MKRWRRRHRRRYRPNRPRRRNRRSCRRRRRHGKLSRPQYRHIGAALSRRIILSGSLGQKSRRAPQDGDAGCGGKICGHSFRHDAPLLSKLFHNAAYAKNDRNLSAKFLSFSACTSCIPLAMMTRRGRRRHRPAGLMRFRFWLLNFFRRFRFLFRRRRTRMMRTSLELRQLRACKAHIAKGICLRSHCKGRSAQRADNSSYDNRPFPNAHIEYPSFILQFLVLIVSQNSLDSIHFVSQFLYNFRCKLKYIPRHSFVNTF